MDEHVDKICKEVRDNIKLAIDAEDDNRTCSLEDVKFENGDQWTSGDKKEREDAGRPTLTINKVAATVKLIIGEARQNNISIKVRPDSDEADQKVAEIFTGLIRNIENISDADVAYDHGFECAVRGAWGYWRVCTDYADDNTFDQDIFIKRIVNPYSVYYDPAAVEHDLTDARWCIVTETISHDEFKARYPKAKSISAIEEGSGEDGEGWYTDEEIRIAEYFKITKKKTKILLLNDDRTVKADDVDYKQLKKAGFIKKEREASKNQVKWFKTNGFEILEEGDWAGKYIPIVPVLGEEVWIEGKKHLRSAIKWAKEPARLYNWARSNAAETLALAPKQPYLVTPEMIDGHENQWDNANNNPAPYLTFNKDEGMVPIRQPASISDTGAMQEAMASNDDIKATTGYFDPSLGNVSNEVSGRAINARKAQTHTSTFVFTDNQVRAMKHTGKVLVDLIPKIYDTQRIVRILGKDGAEALVMVNQAVPGGTLNDLSIGKYDVVVDVGAAFATKRLESVDGMVKLANSAPQYAPILIPRIAKNSDWPDSAEVAEEMQQMNQPQQPNPMQQLELQTKQIENLKKQLEVKEGEIDLLIAGTELEGKRLDNRGKALDLRRGPQSAEKRN